MKIVRYVLAAVLAAFALLQLNDPDPVVWVVAYGLVALCIAAPPHWAAGPGLNWPTAGVLLTLALLSLPGFIGYLTSGDLGSIGGEMSNERPKLE